MSSDEARRSALIHERLPSRGSASSIFPAVPPETDPAALAPALPPPPEDPAGLLEWAAAHDVGARLDDVVIGSYGPAGTFLPSHGGEVLTYRQLLVERGARDVGGGARRSGWEPLAAERARELIHRIAVLAARARRERAFIDEHGREPDDDALARFLGRVRAARRELAADRDAPPRPDGTYEPAGVRVVRAPAPGLRYDEWTLVGPRGSGAVGVEHVVLSLLGWEDGPLRWERRRGERSLPGDVPADVRQSALAAMIDLVLDPRRAAERDALGELLRLPVWQFALGALDDRLAVLDAEGVEAGVSGAARAERVAFRVTAHADGRFNVEPLVQKRGRGGAFSRGSRLPWYNLPRAKSLTPADQRVVRAFEDPFSRGREMSFGGGGLLSGGVLYGVLRALVDHPAVHLEGERDGARLEIRHGRLRLRFVAAPGGALAPQLELLGLALLPSEVVRSLRDDRHFVYLHRPSDGAAPQILLAQISAQAAAVVHALALAPARFPPESHDALAARLESLQESVDIEFPAPWTRTIASADGRVVIRLDLLASGAVHARFGVRPVRLGPVFPPGEGPALVLEGQGRARHGARRDRDRERQAAHALGDRLGLGGGEEIEPWCWRVGEGDAALHLVATLKELGDEIVVEWADERRLVSLGAVGRAQMRMKVADRRDWFAVEGGADAQGEVVPLSSLLAAIREGRRYVAVGERGFVRIEESLREALARADAGLYESHGALQLAGAASDPLMGLVEDEAQVEASAAFRALRRRMAEGAAETARLPPALQAALRPYQAAGVAWMVRLAHWGAGALLADEMGLGKTVQTLAVLAHRAGRGPALVVAPTSVVAGWAAEAARFTPELAVRVYRGPERAPLLDGLGPGDVVVTSYALAALDAARLGGVAFSSLILDEAQAVKNAATERSRALRGLRAEWRLGLTGTPIENHLGELWSLMRVIAPGLLGSWEQFRARFAVPIEKFGDDARRRALAGLLRPFLLRRTKGEVARELPPRTEMVRVVQLAADERALYDQLRASTLADLAEAKKTPERDARDMRFVLLAALTRLRQLCCHPRLVYPRTTAGSSKAAHLLDLLGELREGNHRALVFSQFRRFLELLAPRLRQHGFRVLVLDGTTPAEAREQRIAAFQAGAADVFLISLKAGGFGLNLTAADYVIHLDPWWNPAVEDQAAARAHRIGQRQPVTSVRLVARGTIEEAVLGLHAAKRALAAGVLEGSDVAASLGTDELIDLIRRGGDDT
jgi:superfamily II DNA or RNA helicase